MRKEATLKEWEKLYETATRMVIFYVFRTGILSL